MSGKFIWGSRTVRAHSSETETLGVFFASVFKYPLRIHCHIRVNYCGAEKNGSSVSVQAGGFCGLPKRGEGQLTTS